MWVVIEIDRIFPELDCVVFYLPAGQKPARVGKPDCLQPEGVPGLN
jgi:hypothetical protein